MIPDAILNFEFPCQHALAVGNALALDLRMEVALYWSNPDLVLAEFSSEREYALYRHLYLKFKYYCELYSLPIHNAVAFWQAVLPHVHGYSDHTKMDLSSLYLSLLSASLDYGSFFQYNENRRFPDNFVRLSDLPPDTAANERACVETLINQIKSASSEYHQMKAGLAHFFSCWRGHHVAAKSYLEWQKSYANHVVNQPDKYALDVNKDEIIPLTYIFRQYICLQNEIANSGYLDFEPHWKRFQTSEDSTLLYSFQYIFYMLKTNPHLQKIAPVYVLYIFQKSARKLYLPQPDGKSIFNPHLNPDNPFPHADAKLFSKVRTNQRVPRQAQAIAYEILSVFFKKHYPYPLKIDESLCDYLFQRILPLIGQPRAAVSDEQVRQLITQGVCIPSDSFEKSSAYIHPLLQAINMRLQQSLTLYDKDIPRFSFASSPEIVPFQIDSLVKKIVTSDFLTHYTEILVRDPMAIGADKFSDEARQRLAELLDSVIVSNTELSRLLTRDDSVFSPQTLAAAQNLAAFETAIHRFCLPQISMSIHDSVLGALFSYFQSPAFAKAKCDLRMWDRIVAEILQDEKKRNTSDT